MVDGSWQEVYLICQFHQPGFNFLRGDDKLLHLLEVWKDMVVEVRPARVLVVLGEVMVECEPTFDILASVTFPPSLGKTLEPEVLVCRDGS